VHRVAFAIARFGVSPARASRDAWHALSPAPPSSNRTCGSPASGSPVSCHQDLVEPPTQNREFGGAGPWPGAFTRIRWFTHQAALHSLLGAHSQSRPFAPRGLAASSLLWARPTSDRGRATAYVFAATVGSGLRLPTPADLPGSSTFLSVRAVPNHPGSPRACTRSLLPRGCQAAPIPAGRPRTICVTRPNRFRLRYSSHIRLPGLRNQRLPAATPGRLHVE
jgi:hypothetical protein